MENSDVIDTTRQWISRVVIGLNLCPFAQRVFTSDSIRFFVSEATDEPGLLSDLKRELLSLSQVPREQVETALLIHPRAFPDFLDYNDFLDEAERLLGRLGLEGVIQIATFHPLYQFAGTEPDDVENWTNRSPFPMLHLLREDSISHVADDPDELLRIPERNIQTLRGLGKEKILALLNDIRSDS